MTSPLNPAGVTILDGPVGTQLDARGVAIDGPSWSASALDNFPDVISQIHRDYLAAGATVHTANTFRTRSRSVGVRWESLTRQAVKITRDAVGNDVCVAGSISPLADCYRPDQSPALSDREATKNEHRQMAKALVDAGCDLLLCETFAQVDEALIAVDQAVQTGAPTWLALTAGPAGDLLTPDAVTRAALHAQELGVSAVLVNCIAAVKTLDFVDALASASLSVPFGAYANTGLWDDSLGWNDACEASVATYTRLARSWVISGATIIGGCCGTTPRHIAALTA